MNIEQKEKNRLYHKEYGHQHYLEHKEEYINRKREWRLANPEAAKQERQNQKAYDKAYREAHKEEINEKLHQRNEETQKYATKSKANWTPEDIELLGELLNEGLSLTEIGKELGRSYKSIANAKLKYYKDIKTEKNIAYSRGESR